MKDESQHQGHEVLVGTASGGRVGLRFDPIGGGQFKQAVQQIIEAERQPIKNIETRKTREETKLKLFQEFKGKFSGFDKTLDEFSSVNKFRELKADVGDGEHMLSVTLDKEHATPGTYTLEVNQLAGRSSIITNGHTDPDKAELGVGFIVLENNAGDTAEIFVDSEQSSLRGIARAINGTPDLPVHASVIKDGSDTETPWRLILTSKEDGEQKSVNFPDFYFLDGDRDIWIDNDNESQNAVIKIDGFEIEADSNNVKDFLEGVNLHLKQARPDEPFVLSITQDFPKIALKLKSLVDQVNGVLEFINKQNQVDEKSDTRTTFAGDSGLQNIEYRLRNLLHEGFPVLDTQDGVKRFVWLNQMGIEFDKAGKLEFKEDKVNKALENDFEGISQAVTGKFGIASQLKQVVSGYTRPGDGLMAVRENALRNKIKTMDNDIAEKQRRLDQRTQALVGQFSRLQSSLSNLQKQQQYLSASLPSGGGGGNLVSQLLGG